MWLRLALATLLLALSPGALDAQTRGERASAEADVAIEEFLRNIDAYSFPVSELSFPVSELSFPVSELSFPVSELDSRTAALFGWTEDSADRAGERTAEQPDTGSGIAALGAGAEGMRITETETEIRMELSGDILFDFDRANIRDDAVPALIQVSRILERFPDTRVTIEGHTDSKGSDAYNLGLSERRAASVRDWLVVNARIDAGRLATRGLGKAYPVAPNTHPDGSDNPEGRQRNRRVEIAVEK